MNEWLAQFQLPESAALRRAAAGRACGGTIFALLGLAFAAWMLTLISLAYACGAREKWNRARWVHGIHHE